MENNFCIKRFDRNFEDDVNEEDAEDNKKVQDKKE